MKARPASITSAEATSGNSYKRLCFDYHLVLRAQLTDNWSVSVTQKSSTRTLATSVPLFFRPTTAAPSSSPSTGRPLPQLEHLLRQSTAPQLQLQPRRQPIVRRMSTECLAWTPPPERERRMRTTSAGGPEEFQRLLQNRWVAPIIDLNLEF